MESKKRSVGKWSKAERGELVAAWRASGKPVPAFAAEHGIGASTLYQWINPPKKRSANGKEVGKRKNRKKAPKGAGAFAEVSVVGRAAVHTPVMTVALRGGHSVTFEGGAVDPVWLGSVLRLVSTC